MYMRAGIGIIILLKVNHIFNTHVHELAHITISVTGIAAYFWHMRMMPCLPQQQPTSPPPLVLPVTSSTSALVVYPVVQPKQTQTDASSGRETTSENKTPRVTSL
eukprot:c7320_g1_i2.p2 GENE.c7320_g1_i2~~c7320_g1_i2.p2  ORF type:complete len:105 (+),score=10.24 c7320_g1_i2:627-941(+)